MTQSPDLAEIGPLIARNLPFVDQVALMCQKMTGLARLEIMSRLGRACELNLTSSEEF